MWRVVGLWWRFKRELVLLWVVLRHAQTPQSAKVLAVLVGLYLISPIDLVPEFVPFLGWLDDGILVYALFKIVSKLVPADLYQRLHNEVWAKYPVR